LLQEHDISVMTEDERAAVRAELVGFVFQSFHLLPGLTALENVMLPLELRGEKDARSQAATVLQRVGLEERLTHYPRQLSGGEQQRVAIARAFCSEPQLLFADEPTGNLDSATGAQVIELLFDLNREQGTTLVLVTHEQRLAERCSRSIRLHGGRLVVDNDEAA
jgi:putative ABC transport system ATP-binding protein